MTRRVLSDAQWMTIEPHCLGKKSDPGQTGGDPRLFVEAVLWMCEQAHSGGIAAEFGQWNSVFKRFRRWVKADVFYLLFKALASDADFEYTMIDGTIMKVHRSGQGAKGDSKPGYRQVARWHHNQGSGVDGCTWKHD